MLVISPASKIQVKVGPPSKKKGSRQVSGSVKPDRSSKVNNQKSSGSNAQAAKQPKKQKSQKAPPTSATGQKNCVDLVKATISPRAAEKAHIPASGGEATTSVKQIATVGLKTSVGDDGVTPGDSVIGIVPTGGEQAGFVMGEAAANSPDLATFARIYADLSVKRAWKLRDGLDCDDPAVALRILRWLRKAKRTKVAHLDDERIPLHCRKYATNRTNGLKRRLTVSQVAGPQTFIYFQPGLSTSVSDLNNYWPFTGSQLYAGGGGSAGSLIAGTVYFLRVPSAVPGPNLIAHDEDGNMIPLVRWGANQLGTALAARADSLCCIVKPGTTITIALSFIGTGVWTPFAWFLDPSDPSLGTANQGGSYASAGTAIEFTMPTSYVNGASETVTVGNNCKVSFGFTMTTVTTGPCMVGNIDVQFVGSAAPDPDAVVFDLPDGTTIDGINSENVVAVTDLEVDFDGTDYANEGAEATGIVPPGFLMNNLPSAITYESILSLAQKRKTDFKDGIATRLTPWNEDYVVYKDTATPIFMPEWWEAPMLVTAIKGAVGPCTVSTCQHVQGHVTQLGSQLLDNIRRGGSTADLDLAKEICANMPLVQTQDEKSGFQIAAQAALDLTKAALPRLGGVVEAGVHFAQNLMAAM